MSIIIRFILYLLLMFSGIGMAIIGIQIPGLVIFLIGLFFIFNKSTYKKTK